MALDADVILGDVALVVMRCRIRVGVFSRLLLHDTMYAAQWQITEQPGPRKYVGIDELVIFQLRNKCIKDLDLVCLSRLRNSTFKNRQ